MNILDQWPLYQGQIKTLTHSLSLTQLLIILSFQECGKKLENLERSQLTLRTRRPQQIQAGPTFKLCIEPTTFLHEREQHEPLAKKQITLMTIPLFFPFLSSFPQLLQRANQSAGLPMATRDP